MLCRTPSLDSAAGAAAAASVRHQRRLCGRGSVRVTLLLRAVRLTHYRRYGGQDNAYGCEPASLCPLFKCPNRVPAEVGPRPKERGLQQRALTTEPVAEALRQRV